MATITCERCGAHTRATSMSYFTTLTLCMDCKHDEKGAPNYARARAAEEAACRAGDFNFVGIGLAPEDAAYLAERRNMRVNHATAKQQ